MDCVRTRGQRVTHMFTSRTYRTSAKTHIFQAVSLPISPYRNGSSFLWISLPFVDSPPSVPTSIPKRYLWEFLVRLFRGFGRVSPGVFSDFCFPNPILSRNFVIFLTFSCFSGVFVASIPDSRLPFLIPKCDRFSPRTLPRAPGPVCFDQKPFTSPRN